MVIFRTEVVIYNNHNSTNRNQFQYSPQFYGQNSYASYGQDQYNSTNRGLSSGNSGTRGGNNGGK